MNLYKRMRLIFSFISLFLVSVTMAQDVSITTPKDTYKYGETVTIYYEGAISGDRIVFYQDLSMLPLRESATLAKSEGLYQVEALLEPGLYKAQIVRGGDEIVKDVKFRVSHADLPLNGKRIVLLSDPHVMSPELVQDPTSSSFIAAMADNRKLTAYSAELFDAVIDSIKALQPDLVIITGDLSRDGEAASHQYVAQRLHELKELGINSLVIPGNHDMECKNGRIYTENGAIQAPDVTIAEFREIYEDFGWDANSDCDENSLTYACDPIPNIRFIGIDDCKTYSRGWTTGNQNEYGCIPQPTLDWILQQVDDAVANNKVPVVAVHHQMLKHFNGQDDFVSASLDQGDSIARVFLDHGVRLVLTGHMHMPDNSMIWNADKTDSLLEITSGAPVSYPCQYKILTLDDDATSMQIETRFITSIATLDDVQTEAREQISKTLRSSVKKLVRQYLPKLQKIVAYYSSIDPALETVLQDIPMDVNQLSTIAVEAFGPVMMKIIFTHCEGNENLKLAEDEILEEFHQACIVACDLVFDNQDADTRAFMYTLFEAQLESRDIETTFRSMLSDKSYYGQQDESQINDLYYTYNLRPNLSGINMVTKPTEDKTVTYNLSGLRMSNVSPGQKGVYIVRKDGQTRKVLIK